MEVRVVKRKVVIGERSVRNGVMVSSRMRLRMKLEGGKVKFKIGVNLTFMEMIRLMVIKKLKGIIPKIHCQILMS